MSDELGCIKDFECHIEMKDSRRHKGPTYRVAQEFILEVQRQMQELLKLEVIEEAATDFINSLVVARKPNGDVRICLDARGLNERMVSDGE